MNDNLFGFKQGDLQVIIQAISKFPEIKKAVIFGSRAKGNFRAGSDVDIAIWVTNNEKFIMLPGILNDETLLPYKFDVLEYDRLYNFDLKEQIDKFGVEVYQN